MQVSHEPQHMLTENVGKAYPTPIRPYHDDEMDAQDLLVVIEAFLQAISARTLP